LQEKTKRKGKEINLREMEATAPAAGDRLNFFAQVGQREKRSFMLRRADVTVHKAPTNPSTLYPQFLFL
jgi:hypothetical protein